MRNLNWTDERYVRAYTRNTAEWLLLSWQARGLYLLLRREADRAGIVQLGRAGRRGVAGAVQAGNDPSVLAALEELEGDGWVEVGDGYLVIPEFIESEEARASDAARQRAKRERTRDQATAAARARRDPEAPASRQDVTQARHAMPSRPEVTGGRHESRSHEVTTGGHGRTSRQDVTPNVTPSVPSVPEMDLPRTVVAALDPFARAGARDDDGQREGEEETWDSPPDAVPPARSRPVLSPEVVAPSSGRRPTSKPPQAPPAPGGRLPPAAPGSSPPATGGLPAAFPAGGLELGEAPANRPPRRVQFELQRGPHGEELVDPRTGRPLVLDVAALPPAEVQARRDEALAAMASAGPAPAPGAKTEPSAPVAAPPPSRPRTLGIPDGDPEPAVRRILEAAPAPLRYLATHKLSASRIASVLVGGQAVLADIEDAVRAAALKLDPRLAEITADSPPEQLEDLHRFLAGFVRSAPRMRRAQHGPAVALPAAPSQAGEKLLEAYGTAYRTAFGTTYAAAEDDAMHATAIAAELGRRLDDERTRKPDLDIRRTRPRMVSALFDTWLGDRFGASCGYALRQLARLLVQEPNRFRLFEGAAPAATGAAMMPIDPAPPPRRELTEEDRRRVNDAAAAAASRADAPGGLP